MVSKLSLNSYKILNTYRSVLLDRGILPSSSDRSKNKIGFSTSGNTSLAKLKKIAFETIERKSNPVVVTRVDMSRIVELRKEQKNRMGFIPFVTCALVATLREWMGIYGTEVPTISMAVGTENRTLVSLLSSLKDFSLSHVEKRLITLSEELQRGELPLEAEGQKTFTIMNGGSYSSLSSSSKLAPNQCGFIKMYDILNRPLTTPDDFALRPMMNFSFMYDYRSIDGKLAAPFLARIKERLEDPSWLEG